jgi:hypothetical protein
VKCATNYNEMGTQFRLGRTRRKRLIERIRGGEIIFSDRRDRILDML